MITIKFPSKCCKSLIKWWFCLHLNLLNWMLLKGNNLNSFFHMTVLSSVYTWLDLLSLNRQRPVNLTRSKKKKTSKYMNTLKVRDYEWNLGFSADLFVFLLMKIRFLNEHMVNFIKTVLATQHRMNKLLTRSTSQQQRKYLLSQSK